MKIVIQFLLLISTMIAFASCNGQNRANLRNSDPVKIENIGTRHGKIFKSQPTKNGDAENVRCSFLDKKGQLWFGTTGHGVFRYVLSAEKKSEEPFTLFTKEDGLGGNRVVAICEDSYGNILLGTEKGLYFSDGESISEYLNDDQLKNRSISTLYLDSKGHVWIGTHYSGMYIYDGQTLTSLQSSDHVTNPYDLTLNGISRIIEDHRGNIWMTSWAIADEGIISITGDSLIQQSKIHGLKDSLYYSEFLDSSGKMWFGSRKNGLYSYENGTFTQMTDENGPLVTDCISDILEDKNGFLWFATNLHGVYRYDGRSFVNFTTADGLINNSVFTILEDSTGNIWFGTRNVGLSRYDGKSFVDFSL